MARMFEVGDVVEIVAHGNYDGEFRNGTQHPVAYVGKGEVRVGSDSRGWWLSNSDVRLVTPKPDDLDSYKAKVRGALIAEAKSRQWCSEIDDFLEKIDLSPRKTVTKVVVEFEWDGDRYLELNSVQTALNNHYDVSAPKVTNFTRTVVEE